jgi:tRNA G18 (ribose-2'-O)-methylase SpoU
MNNTTVSKSFLIITNISKRANVRALLQIGVAFGCTKILVVGQKSFSFNTTTSHVQGNKDDDGDDDVNDDNVNTTRTDIPKHLLPVFASGAVAIERFDKWNDCISYINEHNVLLVGVEIHKEAKTIKEICHHLDTINDVLDVAFLMGNEGTGIHDKQMKDCAMFCRIPQYGAGTASLNVYVAASIIFYEFHNYQRQQAQRLEQRYKTDETGNNQI